MGYAVYVGCQWGMLVVLAKLGSPEMVGRFALGLAITAPIILFANLGLRPYQATDAERRYDFGEYLALRLLSTTAALLAVLCVVLLTGYGPETALAVALVGVAKGFEAVSDIFYGLLQQRERMDRVAKSMIFKGLLSLAGLAVAVYLTGSLVWGVVALAAAWALVLCFYDLRSGVAMLGGSFPRPRWGAGRLGTLALTTLPLGLAVVMTSLNANVPRYVVEGYLGTRELGIFAAMAYPVAAGATVVGALGQSASPRLAKHYASGDLRAFRALLIKLLGVGAALGGVGLLVAAVAGREILSLVYTPEYADHANVFVWLMGAAGITYMASFVGFGMIAARKLRAQVPLFVGVIGVTAVSCLFLVPSLGLVGAAVGTMLGVVSQLVGGGSVILRALAASRGGEGTAG
ncbi:oligosaccharide flippase family protein [Rubrobacter marinus]|uniref:Oligosaccharide flippase family protein n=1 Tax=Rubrobacter marinus TaxID=2653852 RepID=A0A6G8PUJ8_9ACTN|nr:oligosaccharide flippase family protein [Rubrobacter marinus]